MATYQCIHQITINNIKVNKVVSVEINKTVESFTNTAKITLPSYLKYQNKEVFSDIDSFILKKGDVVKIKLGYINGAKTYLDNNQFEGFISKIEVKNFEAIIECEDYMYYLKKTKLNFSSNSISLESIGNKLISALNNILPSGIEKATLNTGSIGLDLKNFKAVECTGLEILDHLQQEYILDSFFTGNKLNIGINFTNTTKGKTHTFSMYPSSVIKLYSNETFYKIIDPSNLKYVKAEDIKYKITAKVFKPDGTVVEKESGDEDGQQRTFVFYGTYSDSQIKVLVDNQIQRIKYSGFQKGSSFLTFGKPDIDLLDLVSFDGLGYIRWYENDNTDTQKRKVYEKSTYLINSIQLTYNQSGLFQTIGLANRVNIPADSNSIASKIEGGKVIKL